MISTRPPYVSYQKDTKVRERLLRVANLSLSKTDEICRASESMLAQIKIVGHIPGSEVNRMEDQERSTSLPRRNKKSRRRSV